MKKVLSLLSLAFVFAGTTPANAEFSDIGGHPAGPAVSFLQDNGVVKGFEDGSFKPDQEITRYEFTKIILEAYDLVEENCSNPPKTFSDLPKNHWAYTYVCSAVKQGIINGYADGTFGGDNPIMLVEAAKIIAEAGRVEIPENAGDEWFAGYMAALHRERVLPGDVEENGANISRGNMSEMVWGLQTGNEVENENLGELPQIESCEELSTQFKKHQLRSSYRYGGETELLRFDALEMEADDGAGVEESAPTANSALKSESGAADQYSTTNVQEFGVDEADIIKNDGSHIFLVKGNSVRIVAAYPSEDLEQVSSITLDKGNFSPRELYLDGDVLTVIGSTYGDFYTLENAANTKIAADIWPAPSGGMLKVISYDISDRKNPQQIRSVAFEGNYLNSRKIGTTVYVAVNKYAHYYSNPIPLLKESDMPAFFDSARAEEKVIGGCESVRYFPNFSDPNFLILAAINTMDPAQKVEREVLLGSGQEMYASSENLYITRQTYDEVYFAEGIRSGWNNAEFTDIYKFALKENDIKFVTKGRTEGRVLNQFSMSEYDNHFRIATQKGWAWGNETSSNNVFIFDANLKQVGAITGIAPGEDIKSVRFMGKKGYVVTFKTVDPLFVLDMTPANPKILGKLKIPGWSDYLHPYDENHLIGFGKEVDESIDADKVHSNNAVYYTAVLGMKLSIFDVSDLENPKEIHKEVIGYRGSTSEVLNNHKALLFDKEKGILAFPVTVTENKNGKSGQEADIHTVFSGAYVYDVDLENGFFKRGEVSHYESEDWYEKSGEWFYGDFDRNIQRMMYIGENFYSISPNIIKALSWDNISVKNTLTLDEKQCDEIWNEHDCSTNAQCRTIWRVSGECYLDEESGESICEDSETFLRCEAK